MLSEVLTFGFAMVLLFSGCKPKGTLCKDMVSFEPENNSFAGQVVKIYTLLFTDGLNEFRAVGFSDDFTESNPYMFNNEHHAAIQEVALHPVCIGINRYKSPALNLDFAEPDARSICEFFTRQKNPLFAGINPVTLYNEAASRSNIINAMKSLQKTQPQDAVIIYMAGHGENIENKWYFIPYDLVYPEKEEEVKGLGISSDMLSSLLKNIWVRKILMMIDACKSGAALVALRGFEDRKALMQLARSNGIHVVAASDKNQFAGEIRELGHGLFTYTVLEGLRGKASGGGSTVTVRKLLGFVEEELPEITRKYRQEASIRWPIPVEWTSRWWL